MTSWLQHRLTYANVMATIAVAMALGGTSYAAFVLPANSVGPHQLRRDSVRSIAVRNHSLQVADLSNSARKALHGATGPQGPAGAPGPAGPAAAEYFAVVAANGSRVAGNATGGAKTAGLGSYTLSFPRSLAGCAVTATLGTSDGSTAPAGRIAVNIVDGQAGVQTYGPDGSAADLPFHLIAAC